MKKVLAIALALIMMLSVLTACGGKSGKKESVELYINVPVLTVECLSNPECEASSDFIKAMWDSFAAQYDKYDVSLRDDMVFNFEQTAYAENIPEKYGTKDCPDISFGGYFAMSCYMYDGYMIPLDDVITDEIYADFPEATWESSRGSNGKTYLLPFYSLMNILSYNKDMFRECGLDEFVSDKEEIQGWSLEEWNTILATLKEKLPKNTYPMMMYAKNIQGDTHTMVQLRCKGSDFFDKDGLFNLNTPEGIAGLQWIKDNYDKGYYPSGCEDLEINDTTEMFTAGQIAIYVWNSALAGQYHDFELGYVNFPGATDAGANSNWVTGFMAFDNGDEKKIEVVKDFLRYVYETPELMDYSTAGLPCAKSVSARWADKMVLGQELAADAVNSVNFTANNPNWAGVRAAFWPHIYALLTGEETAEEAAQGLDRDCNEAITSVVRTLHE